MPAAPRETLPRFARVPLMHCRHAVGNYVGLFQALFEIFYETGEADGPVVVQPDGTVGEALGLDEQKVADALAAPVGERLRESVLLGLMRTILEDGDMTPETVDAMLDLVARVLRNGALPTFADKADGLADALDALADTPIGPSRAQADEMIPAVRGIGTVVSDLVGLRFPRLDAWRIDLDDEPERWVELTGHYTVLLPSRAEELLSVSFANDRLTVDLHIDTVRLHGASTARFFRIDPRGRNEGEEQERHELVLRLAESALGSFELHGITLALQLDDRLERAAREPFAPRHRMRLADWARPALKVNVDSADIVIYRTWLSSLIGLLELGLGIDLEEFLEQRVLARINGQDDLHAIGEKLRDYVGPVADRLIPRAYVAEIVRYRDPFVRLRPVDLDDGAGARASRGRHPTRWEPEIELRFEGLKTRSEGGGVAVRNPAPDPIEIDDRPIGGPDFRPGNFDDLNPPAGEWAWPSARPGELIQLDLGDTTQRGHALAALASVPELTPRGRAMAALSVDGLDPRRIGALRRDAVELRGRTVLGRPASPQTLEWLQESMRDSGRGPHVFRTADYPADVALVSAELRHVQQAMVRQARLGRPPEPGGPLVRPFDAGIWTMDHEPRSPLARRGGSPRDPAWYGLSTNCVGATTVYRSLRDGGQLERAGRARSGTRTLAWRVEGCTDVAADFSGRAWGDAPALAVAQIAVGIGPDLDQLVHWRADVRLRLKPRSHGSGCLSDASVLPVLQELACIEAMTRGEVPEVTRLRELEFRGFVFLAADLTERARDIELVSLQDAAGTEPPPDDPVHTELRDVLADWLAGLPEVPVLYNPFRSIPGASDRGFSAYGGWLCIERRYRFPDLAGLRFE